MTNIVVLDTMPIPGDIGLKDFVPRGSEWQPLFAGQLSSNPPFASVEYSTEHNPCRLELQVFPPNCTPPNWSTSLPAGGSSAVGAIKVGFGSLVLNPNDSVQFTWVVDTPVDAPVGAVAWNSFGYIATRTDNGSQLESAEPTKVGLQVEAPPGPPPPPELPPTGADASIGAVIAVLLLVGGTVLMLVSRRPSPRAAAG